MNWWQGLGIGLILLGIMLQGIVFVRSENTRTKEAYPDKKGFIVSYKILGYILIVVSAISFGVGHGFRKQAILYLDDAFFGALIGALTSLLFFLVY
jgi:drug/metabolite transporter (DMT)-like permease